MPSKLFQRRREEARGRAVRQKVLRADLLRVLIVAEGSRTEPNYLEEYLRVRKLGHIVADIPRTHETDPLSLLARARKIIASDNDYDYAFIVADRDEFMDFDQARNAASQVKCKPPIKYIYSDPCFELWIILHFTDSTAPLSRGEALAKAKSLVPGYEKGEKAWVKEIIGSTDQAVNNSIKVLGACAATGASCPSTLMHELIAALTPE